MEKFYKFIKHETFVSYSQSKFINRFIGYKKKEKTNTMESFCIMSL